ncbi:hypothetical protein R3W88_004180 [Solanum pinnatisectum]|uniref:Uncharacterized protein n=1 Tax=Solanum pinnatisectum TaxID=50273 RepID=A0AAV9K8V5_9SOLN|nr:hypothetical protein R3W88_004180 [Solanum pinnatisectum]
MEKYQTPDNKRREISFPTSSEVVEKLYYLKCDSYEKMEDEVTEWVEMMLLMEDPPLTKTFEISEKVVAKSPNDFTISPDGVHEITSSFGEVNSVDGWSEAKRGCQRNLQL